MVSGMTGYLLGFREIWAVERTFFLIQGYMYIYIHTHITCIFICRLFYTYLVVISINTIYVYIYIVLVICIIVEGSLVEKLPIYERHRRVNE